MYKTPSEELLAARRALEGMQGVKIVYDLVWNARVERWVLVCRLSPRIQEGGLVPSTSDWYVLIEPSYPWGEIKCYPAKEGGVSQTFPHQTYNAVGDSTLPWRSGDICLDTDVRALGRHGYDSEPYDAHRRLRWRLQRALDWLRAAGSDELILSGEPFELPQFPTKRNPLITIAYTESAESFLRWQATPDRFGIIDLSESACGAAIIRHFRTPSGRTIWVPEWGTVLTATTSDMRGVWLRLEKPPVVPPWQAPTTWGELRDACRLQGIDLDDMLRRQTQLIRDRKRHFAIIGYPIPELRGDFPSRMRWEALLFPVLAADAQAPNGFRPNEVGHWHLDRTTILSNNAEIEWIQAENWDATEIATRGRLQNTLTSMRITLLGAGALGSIVAELLVRAGCKDITIVDGDRIGIGNLVRHTLGVDTVGKFKAEEVVQQLNRASPHASLIAINTFFPPADEADQTRMRESDIVIDCTGSDSVLYHIEQFEWEKPKLFISLSLSLRARRLYCFSAYGNSFPHAAFRNLVGHWITQDLDEYAGQELPREGIGCWHPVFPARYDDIVLMAANAVKYTEGVAMVASASPSLTVFEQIDNNGFAGVRRLPTEVVDG